MTSVSVLSPPRVRVRPHVRARGRTYRTYRTALASGNLGRFLARALDFYTYLYGDPHTTGGLSRESRVETGAVAPTRAHGRGDDAP
jgi:hypothetical protein